MIWIKRRSEGFAVSSIAALEHDNAISAYRSVNYPRHLSLVTKAVRSIKYQDYLDAACEAVCPLQPACGHLHAMSGVFSIASHSVLQYFPEVTLQEQTGWAHFLLSDIESPFRQT